MDAELVGSAGAVSIEHGAEMQGIGVTIAPAGKGGDLMPISPERMKLYPGGSIRSPEWLAIRGRILTRAGNCCEGNDLFPTCRAANGEPHPETRSKVVLTIGHMNHTESDCRDENLKAWCQRCHLAWDAPRHRLNSSITRAEKQGQSDLFGRPP